MTESKQPGAHQELAARLAAHPALRARVEELLAVIESEGEERLTAAGAEERVGEQLRGLGQATLQAWAEGQQARQEAYWDARTGVNRKEKKSSLGTRATGR
jgi:hypothetical protein